MIEKRQQRFYEKSTFTQNGVPEWSMRLRTVEVNENVLNMVQQDASTSTIKIANGFNVSTRTVWKILKQQLLCPYHIQSV